MFSPLFYASSDENYELLITRLPAGKCWLITDDRPSLLHCRLMSEGWRCIGGLEDDQILFFRPAAPMPSEHPVTRPTEEPALPCTERLQLRYPLTKDIPALFNIFSNPKVTATLRFLPYRSMEDYRRWITPYIDNPRDGQLIVAALKGTEQPIGTMSLSPSGVLGWAFGEAYWNRGYAREAVKAFCRWSFDAFPMSCLFSRHLIENPASGRVMRACGFKFVGPVEEYNPIKKTHTTLFHWVLRRPAADQK